ncbi:arginine--tRNA ligase [Candidatus Woesearchaeota archaeon]|nr:arginine--tRNA ligase [Candidatus Woesearchaeota archaeon]
MFLKEVEALIKKYVQDEVSLEVPPNPAMGDYAFPCFGLAKKLKKGPFQIAIDIAKQIKPAGIVKRVEATGPYVNFFLDKAKVAEKVLTTIREKRDKYGSSTEGDGRTVLVEYSSPNIAKPFGIGHLRSTIIGESLHRLHRNAGYKVIRANHLGDWGTQFGGLIHAYLTWGDKEKLRECPIKHLVELYVKFNETKEKDPGLEQVARDWFKKIEENNSEAVKLWSKFKHLSIDEFRRIYELLKVEFDTYEGESFYTDKMDAAIAIFEEKGLAEIDDGALVVKLDNTIPLMLRKSDGASTYAARDVAALRYRLETYTPAKMIYVVGQEQILHFQQLFASAKKAGWEADLIHVPFGLYLSPEGGKMATRKGTVVFLEDVLTETIALARKTIEEKNPSLKDKDAVAASVGIGAVVFGDLANDRVRDITFDWKKILDFEGDTGPYVQYTAARAGSILVKATAAGVKQGKLNYALLELDAEQRLESLLGQYPENVQEALKSLKPHIIAQYLLQLCRTFNEFYHAAPVMTAQSSQLRDMRLLLVGCTQQVIKNGLYLLGIETPEEM